MRKKPEGQLSLDYNLYGGTPPHVAGSKTSRAAAQQARAILGSQQHQVLLAIRSSGKRGLTCDEIEEQLGGRHQAISARVRELFLKGMITKAEATRPTRSGRQAVVYLAAKRGSHG